MKIVEDFFAAMARRDLAGVRSLLAPQFVMTVSGGHRFADIAEFLAHSRGRQGAVRKHVAGFDISESDGRTVVYCHGTMSGTWLDGTCYQDIRFVDRFAIQDGRIATLDVYSDMAEFRPIQPVSAP